MNTPDINTQKNQYLSTVLQSIQMEVAPFMQNLIRGEKYERMIFNRTMDFFHTGMPVEEAVQQIHQWRRLILFHQGNDPTCEKKSQKNKQKVLRSISNHTAYHALTPIKKQQIAQRITTLVNTRLYTNYTIHHMILPLLV